MKEHTKSNSTRLIVASISIVFLGVCLFTVGKLASGSSEDMAVPYHLNENGLTFGSTLNVDDPKDAPDLILVLASNGKEGYVFKTDLDEATPLAKNPEEAVRTMKEYETKSAAAFSRSLIDSIGIAISEEKIIASNLVESGRFDLSAFETEESINRLYSVLGFQTLSDEVSAKDLESAVRKAADAANHANMKSIPVYSSDGKTVVGEFEIL